MKTAISKINRKAPPGRNKITVTLLAKLLDPAYETALVFVNSIWPGNACLPIEWKNALVTAPWDPTGRGPPTIHFQSGHHKTSRSAGERAQHALYVDTLTIRTKHGSVGDIAANLQQAVVIAMPTPAAVAFDVPRPNPNLRAFAPQLSTPPI